MQNRQESVQYDTHTTRIDTTPPNNPDFNLAKSIYEFTVMNIRGDLQKLDVYRGHICIATNVATKSPLTEIHYKQMNELMEKFGDSKGLRILAFPCNQFGLEEPGTPSEIAAHARIEAHNVKFDIFHKVEVNGENASPLWNYMKFHLAGRNKLGDMIKWNYTKFIITRAGTPVERHGPEVEPVKFEELLKRYW